MKSLEKDILLYGGKEVNIEHNKIAGVEYLIRTIGFTPTAYINVKSERNCNLLMSGIYNASVNLGVHGGITFHGRMDSIGHIMPGYWIGWDYGHWGDYTPGITNPTGEGKKWTVDEIRKDVKHAIGVIMAVLNYGE